MVRQGRFCAIALLALGLLLSGCPQGSPEKAADGGNRRIRVVTTVGMLADAVRNIGGEAVEVQALMGPGVDPHLYRATAGDVRTLDGADLILYVGLELEGRMSEIFEQMARRGKPAVAIGERIPKDHLRRPEEFEGRYDPHLWFDVVLWKQAAAAIGDELARRDPAGADRYRRNTEEYQRQLDDLHRYVQSEIARIPETRRVLITAHDAFGYFGQRYGMEVLGLQGTSTAAEAGAGDVRRLADLIARRRIKAIFVESSVPRATIEAVRAAVRARGWNVEIGGELFSDALGPTGTPEGTYIGMVRHNVNTIVKALQ